MATKPRTLTLTLTLALSTFAILAADKGEKKLDLSKVDLSKLPAPAAKTGVTYAADVKPIFEKSCFKCHGPEKQKAKLRLDSLEAALKGGQDGKVVEPGKSAESILIANVAHLGDEELILVRFAHLARVGHREAPDGELRPSDGGHEGGGRDGDVFGRLVGHVEAPGDVCGRALCADPAWQIATCDVCARSTELEIEVGEEAAGEQHQADPDHPGPLRSGNRREEEQQGGDDQQDVRGLHGSSLSVGVA